MSIAHVKVIRELAGISITTSNIIKVYMLTGGNASQTSDFIIQPELLKALKEPPLEEVIRAFNNIGVHAHLNEKTFFPSNPFKIKTTDLHVVIKRNEFQAIAANISSTEDQTPIVYLSTKDVELFDMFLLSHLKEALALAGYQLVYGSTPLYDNSVSDKYRSKPRPEKSQFEIIGPDYFDTTESEKVTDPKGLNIFEALAFYRSQYEEEAANENQLKKQIEASREKQKFLSESYDRLKETNEAKWYDALRKAKQVLVNKDKYPPGYAKLMDDLITVTKNIAIDSD